MTCIMKKRILVDMSAHIFAYLAEDPEILKYRTPSASRLDEFEMIENQLKKP